MNTRYIFKNKSDFFHHWYDGTWNETIAIYFPDQYKTLLDIAIDKGVAKDVAPYHVKGWVKLMDPSCYQAHEIYNVIQNTKLDKRVNLIQQMTLPGVMTSIIDMAKKSKLRHIPRGETGSIENRMSRLISSLIIPTSHLYHRQFAEDLFALKPIWCRAELSKEEQKELIQVYLNKHGKAPLGLEAKWFIPSDHRLYGYKGSIYPKPNGAYRALGGKDEKTKQALLATIKNKKQKPKEWNIFKYRYPDWCEIIENQYPEVLKYSSWIKDNLTDKQQKEVENWKKLEQLLCNKLSTNEIFQNNDAPTNTFIGNYMKNINAKRKFSSKKVLNIINPIKAKIKKWRPDIVKMYSKPNKDRLYEVNGYGAKNKDTMTKLLEMAKNGEDRPSGGLTYALHKFTHKKTRYPDFAKEIKTLRPDWFDQKEMAKQRRIRFIVKRKKLIETLNK